MKIHYETTADVARYIETHRDAGLEGKERQFERYLRPVSKFKEITPETEILEVGTGTGWFPLMCELRGLRCRGLEISPQLIEMAFETGKRYGVRPDIQLGNLEDYKLPDNYFDVVIASSVFEHVEDWRTGIHKLYKAMKPRGVLFFESTNKFSFTSGEYNRIPLYGWMPNSWRYALRKMIHGPDIMKLGIDFHQFTHTCLRREFQKAGFSRVLDRIDAADEQFVSSGFRRKVVRLARQFGPFKGLALTFAEATRFICIK